ncbi:S-antigen protein [Liparis tanakae]|uniref:S-antigen protein n=1 Tax=Liparis tanakae TaxID=230148 RepID=A0A4Z2E1I3_9TELE|nr:S-antigen protein [Liparis tanakae]
MHQDDESGSCLRLMSVCVVKGKRRGRGEEEERRRNSISSSRFFSRDLSSDLKAEIINEGQSETNKHSGDDGPGATRLKTRRRRGGHEEETRRTRGGDEEETRRTRGGDEEDTRRTRGGDEEETRRTRGGHEEETRTRGGHEEDTRRTRGGHEEETRRLGDGKVEWMRRGKRKGGLIEVAARGEGGLGCPAHTARAHQRTINTFFTFCNAAQLLLLCTYCQHF